MSTTDTNDHLSTPPNTYYESLFRNMLPHDAPLPDEHELDCTINLNPPIIKTPPPPFTYLATQHENNDNINTAHLVSFEKEQETSTVENKKPKKKEKKKNVCSRCGERMRVRETEKCVVCDARYCGVCVTKAMMPEGRRCVGCVELVADDDDDDDDVESRRWEMGRCSRLLCNVYSALEVREISKVEKECYVKNMVSPEQVVVNGGRLTREEWRELLGCAVPPVKLKPGRYWYDKESGLWGQEGGKPDRIVSSKLNVGGKLQVDASNGNTGVYINGREITKAELRILKLSKAQGTHFWLYDDGSYEEEGQNNIKGNIWRNVSTRFISSLFCLPVPRHRQRSLTTSPNVDHSRVQKLLLFGLEGSGTSTIFKQVRFLYGDKFTDEELQHLKLIIQSNTFRYLSNLLEARQRFEEEEALKADNQGDLKVDHSVYTLKPKFKQFCDWLLDITATGDFESYFPAATREYAPLVHDIWNDPAIQETYKRMHFLPDVAKCFLDKVIELSNNSYEPSEEDILYAQGVNVKGLSYLDFSTNDQSHLSVQSSLITTGYQLIRMSTNYNRCKWLDMFEGTHALVYCIALTDYEHKNKMLENRDIFETLTRHPCFVDIPFILILNKYDAFEEKISQTPLTVCEWFHDFRPLKPYRSLANQAYYYVAMKFKKLYASITGRKLFVWQCVARQRSSVEQGLKYIREVIRWYEQIEDVYGIDLGEDDSFYDTQLEVEQ